MPPTGPPTSVSPISSVPAVAEVTLTPTQNFQLTRQTALATASMTSAIGKSSRHNLWPTPNVMSSSIPTTLITMPATTPTVEALSFTTHIMNNAAELTTTQVTATPSLGKPLLDTPATNLPGWPPFLTFLLFGWITVAWIVGIVLFYATFPEKVEWLADFVLDFIHGKCTGGESSPHPDEPHLKAVANTNSAATATGLGISLDGSPANTPRLRRPLALDPESLELLKKDFFGIPKTKEEFYRTFSAPLPSQRRFDPSTPSPTIDNHDDQPTPIRHRRADLEGGLQSASPAPGSFEVDGRDIWVKEQGKSRRGYGITAFLESVNAGIGFVAGKLAKMASDDVRNGAESGLVLPVRNAEREHAGAELV